MKATPAARALGAATTAALLFQASPACAGESEGLHELPYLLGVPALVLSLPPDIANSIDIGRGERSPLGWRIYGYASSVVAVAAGAVTVVAYTGSSEVGNADQGPGLAVGWGTLALGAVDAVLATWAGSLPQANVGPVALRGADGRTHLGAALTLRLW
jgi:hypothetical protein